MEVTDEERSGKNEGIHVKREGFTRREILLGAIGGGILSASGVTLLENCSKRGWNAETFIGKMDSYEKDIASLIVSGFTELKVTKTEIKGKRILLKPNLVEPHLGAGHINTHPNVIRGVAEAFFRLGASQVLVAEGSGHCRDSQLVLDESGLGRVLLEDRIPFVDLNYDEGYSVENAGRHADIDRFTFPRVLRQVDWIVSVAKMKTHHWSGVTLSMKNLFGVMPGIYYGWPKNVLHWKGIEESVLDICQTLRPHFAIVDGIIGMEGDGPIMGDPHHADVLVMGRNLTAVDATCAQIMGINPKKIKYIRSAMSELGSGSASDIMQRGEAIASVRTNFALMENIHAHRGLRLI